MLRVIRSARFGQIALGIAGILAIAGSFGLHPEPASAPRFAGARWSAAIISSATHGCPVCLAHRPAPVAALVVTLLGPPDAVGEPQPASVPAVRPTAPLAQDGRAPPV
jgi:predicted cobalt transporter CbtA